MSAAVVISSNWGGSGNASSGDTPVVTDERLVAAAKSGDTGAFDELCKRHARKMFRITHRITRNRENAEDAVQECLLNAFIHLRSFDGRSRFSTWLTRIAVNAALMKLRKNRAGHEVPIEEPFETGGLPPEHRLTDPSLNPEERYAKSEREAILRDAIAKLRPRIRKTLEIYQLQERSLDETAEILGISVTAAKARLFQARAALRKASYLEA
jgi:RNA polymerase sigma-70 factor (ECF subfamily)